MYQKGIFLILFCSAFAVGYDLGSTYTYSYVTTTTLDEECRGESEPRIIGNKLVARVHLTAVWQNPQKPTQQLIELEVLKPTLSVSKKSSFEIHSSELDDLSSKPFFILREDGVVLNVWDSSDESPAIRNIKRGIASLLQTQNKITDGREADVAGVCEVIYEWKGENVQKQKSNCIHSKFDKSRSQFLGIRSMSTQHLLLTDCKISESTGHTISKCTAAEYVKSYSNVWKKPTLCLNAHSELLSDGVVKGKVTFKNKDVESVIEELRKNTAGSVMKSDLEAILFNIKQTPKNKLIDIIKKLQDSLKNENLAKLKSALAFYKILPLFQMSTKEDTTTVLQNKKFKSIKGQILDLIAASSNEESLEATFEYFQDEKGYDEMLERFLISLSVTPRPDKYVMREIKNFLESKKRHEKIHASLISTLGAILKTYSKHHGITNNQILEDYRAYLEKGLKGCTKPPCTIVYLRGLKNAAFSKSLPLLIEYALKGGKSALEAMLAVRSIEIRHLPNKIQYQLLNVFLQVGYKQDRSTRSVAFEILLDLHLDTNVLQGILTALSDQTDIELSTFLVSKIFHKMSVDNEFRSRIFKLLPEKFNYYSWSQIGASSLFKNQLMNSDGTNVTYGIQMEMLAGNLLKRSIFEVNFEQPEISNLLKVGMFAEGIESLAGGSSEEGVDPQAGMELTLLGSSLRPYIFFTGTSELMGHAWSGTASKPTPALQGIFSFSDDERLLVLHNGMVAQQQLRGILSTDLSASIQISLWGQNSQSEVKNAAAFLMRGAVTVDAGFSSLQGAFQFSGQSAINFNTNLVFSESPFKMCLEMAHPDITIKHENHRSVTVSGSDFILKRTKRRKREIPRKSYALHEKNNEQCRQLDS